MRCGQYQLRMHMTWSEFSQWFYQTWLRIPLHELMPGIIFRKLRKLSPPGDWEPATNALVDLVFVMGYAPDWPLHFIRFGQFSFTFATAFSCLKIGENTISVTLRTFLIFHLPSIAFSACIALPALCSMIDAYQ